MFASSRATPVDCIPLQRVDGAVAIEEDCRAVAKLPAVQTDPITGKKLGSGR